MSQLIDMDACREFMKETLDKVQKDELIAIAGALEEKSNFFNETLNPDKLSSITEEDLVEVFRNIFVTRRRVKTIFEQFPVDHLKLNIHNLLHGEEEVEQRFQQFFDLLGDLDVNLKFDLTGELLHYTFPDRYWLWGRWMWDPKVKTGAIPLVTSEGFDLEAPTMGEMYMKVGKGVAFVHSIAEAAEFQFISRTLFGTDVFLSCVYIVYAYTVLRMRMTQEFNKVMPGLPEFSRRLLGVYRIQKAA